MIKIIANGHNFIQTECKYCSCVFQFEEEDIQEKNAIIDKGITWATDWKLTCPYCKKEIWIRDTCDIKRV